MTFSPTFHALNETSADRILILDGSMGYMIQQLRLSEADFRGAHFANYPQELKGCNDLLCLTAPQAIRRIHEQYISAGADIIETCSFNANAVSLADYALEPFAYEINKAAAAIARSVADKYSDKFVAGSIGPTSKSGSISPNADDPAARAVGFDELAAAYSVQIRGLLDGGVDILLIETVFDGLNARAALFAAQTVMRERGELSPIIVSLSIAGPSGRLLAGQTVEAFCASVSPFDPWAVGLNCSFGADTLKPYVKAVADFTPSRVSAYPNAGLPNLAGEYDDTPEVMAKALEAYMREGLLNVVGGCCGTTPSHIAALVETSRRYKPRAINPPTQCGAFYLSGLETLKAENRTERFILIGERTNVAGSRQFLRLIKEENYAAASVIARKTVESGAKIIDVCMDDALLDAETAMTLFLNTALSDPDVAKAPIMIDSSRWEVVVAGLKCVQGKSLVNSISLKEGVDAFLKKARTARDFGAAVVVMLFDEEGQAARYERKIAVAVRSYRLLTEDGFPPQDIVFDPNVLSIATGVSEHDSYALDFIRACSWIRENCPSVQISGGISNLSFSFRGNNTVREAMHSVFLHHAVKAGLSMGIVNPATLVSYEDLAPDLRLAAEDAVLNRMPDAAERLLALAAYSLERDIQSAQRGNKPQRSAASPQSLPPSDRIRYAMLNGADETIVADALELAQSTSALAVVEGPLMDAMREIGALFGEGKLFLPQVVRSARVMKKAVAALEPLLHGAADDSDSSGTRPPPAKILLATVKGDVHDIGKNIVSVILACNGYEIIDLGVMVQCETIIETAKREKVDAVGLSGLITPSLDEMIAVAKAMKVAGLTVPLLIGGAAASLAHTALKIAPEYAPVVYSQDAGQAVAQIHSLFALGAERDAFLDELEKTYQTVRESRLKKQAVRQVVALDTARTNRFVSTEEQPTPRCRGLITLRDYPVERVIPFMDWKLFFYQWGARSDEAAEKLRIDADAMLRRIVREKLLTLRGLVGLFPAKSENETVTVFHEGRETAFIFPRNLEKNPNTLSGKNLCLADFVPKDGWVGLFALSAGFGVKEFKSDDDYSQLLLSIIANTLAEAFAEEVHLRVRTEWWGYSTAEKAASTKERGAAELLTDAYPGARFGFGYPSCPNHEDKRLCFDVLHVEEKIGVTLTESFMMLPEASVCGLLVSDPNAFYFSAV
jgi:5-methyltetrahydrofolate--homocysteine methyltransferase